MSRPMYAPSRSQNMSPRKTFHAALLTLILFAALFIALPARPAHAAETVNQLGLLLDVDEGGLMPYNTEWTAQKALRSLAETNTTGVLLDRNNSFLQVWNDVYAGIYGIGDGSRYVSDWREYYFDFDVAVEPGYDWPDEIKALPKDELTASVMLDDFEVWYNGVQRGDCVLKYNSQYNEVHIIVPIANTIYADIDPSVFTYDGKAKKPSITSVHTPAGNEVASARYYSYYVDEDREYVSSPKNAGWYTLVVQGSGIFNGTAETKFAIRKAPNPMKVTGRTTSVKWLSLLYQNQTLSRSKVLTVKNAKGTVTYTKKSGSKKITIAKKTGKVTVKKGLARGTYKVRVRVRSVSPNYKTLTKNVTFRVRVK